MVKKRQGHTDIPAPSHINMASTRMEIKSIMKDIEFLGSKHMTWKERKELENRKVVSLGGKPPKKQRLPLSVARVTMKRQKERDQKMLLERSIIGQLGGNFRSDAKRSTDKRKPEDRVLKSTAGSFRNGVLDVKHLLQPTASTSRDGNGGSHGGNKGKKRKGVKGKQGKKGGGRKCH